MLGLSWSKYWESLNIRDYQEKELDWGEQDSVLHMLSLK